MKKSLLIFFLCMAFGASNAMPFTTRHPGEGSITIFFDHYVGDKILQFDTVVYNDELGQALTITKFKYYIGNIKLKKANGELISYPDYFLVNEEEPASKKINLNNVASGEYAGIEFIVGVDSLHNCSGAQSGALDPINAMFWAWNTGYIFLKLEGKCPSSKSPGNIFEFHIGGYKEPNNCVRQVSLIFDHPIFIPPALSKDLHVKTDIAAIFTKPTLIDISKLSSVTDFHNATTIADNYVNMFSILSIK